MCEDITKRKAWQTNDSGVGRNLGNFGGRKASSSEMGRGGRKHLLFPGTGYGNRDLILASSRHWLRTRREMKGKHMGGTTVVVLKERREKLLVCTPGHRILLVLTIMSSSGAKPPLKLLALGKCASFYLSTIPLAN